MFLFIVPYFFISFYVVKTFTMSRKFKLLLLVLLHFMQFVQFYVSSLIGFLRQT